MNLSLNISELCIVRHCATENNERAIMIGTSDPELSALGQKQLSSLKDWFNTQDFSQHKFISSDLRRCSSTAQCLSSDVLQTSKLRERKLGIYENMSSSDVINRKDTLGFETRDPSLIWDGIQGVESDKDIVNRVFQHLNKASNNEESKFVVVTHAGVLKAITYYLLDIPSSRPYAIKFSMGSVIVLGRNGNLFELKQLWENPLSKIRFSP